MNKIMKIPFLFSTVFLMLPLYAADVSYCSDTAKPCDSKNEALQKVLKNITTDHCVIGNNCISSTAPYISYTVQLEGKQDKNAVKCSWGTSITVRCIDGVARPGEARTGFCRVVSGAGGPDISEKYHSPPCKNKSYP